MTAPDPAATILVVEDDAATRTYLADNLTADGYDLLVAGTAPDALALMETRFPDLAIVDLGLPGPSGLDLVGAVRRADGVASRVDPELPILVLSGRAGELDRLRGFERGCDDYVTKAIRSSRRARGGADCCLSTTMAPPAGADIEQPYCVAAGVGGPSSSHRARVHGWASRWRRGPLGDAEAIKRRSTPGPVCARFRPRLRSSAHARTARSRVVPCDSLMSVGEGARSLREAAAAAIRWSSGSRDPRCLASIAPSECLRSGARGALWGEWQVSRWLYPVW